MRRGRKRQFAPAITCIHGGSGDEPCRRHDMCECPECARAAPGTCRSIQGTVQRLCCKTMTVEGGQIGFSGETDAHGNGEEQSREVV